MNAATAPFPTIQRITSIVPPGRSPIHRVPVEVMAPAEDAELKLELVDALLDSAISHVTNGEGDRANLLLWEAQKKLAKARRKIGKAVQSAMKVNNLDGHATFRLYLSLYRHSFWMGVQHALACNPGPDAKRAQVRDFRQQVAKDWKLVRDNAHSLLTTPVSRPEAMAYKHLVIEEQHVAAWGADKIREIMLVLVADAERIGGVA